MNIKGKKILFITHQLTQTGAPLVLFELLEAARKQEAEVSVISMANGPLLEKLLEENIPCMIQSEFVGEGENEFKIHAQQFDLVIANTLLTYEVIHLLKKTFVPVLWWIHEGEHYFDYFKDVLPDLATLEDNIFPFAVSLLVRDIVEKRYRVTLPVFMFGIKDEPRKTFLHEKKRVTFLIAGTISYLKGQDIFLEAMQNMEEDVFLACDFIFCASLEIKDEEIFSKLKAMEALYDNITILPAMPKETFLDYLETVDCLVVPSRLDTVSSVAVEMLMKSGICICSDACGIKDYIKNKESGYIFESQNVLELTDVLTQVYEQIQDNQTKEMADKARAVYETYFSNEIFMEKSCENMRHAISINEAYYAVCKAVEKNDWEEAAKYANEMLKRPFCDKQAILLAYINFYYKEDAQALFILEKGLAYNPKNYEIHYMLGSYYHGNNQDEAIKHFNKALEFSKGTPDYKVIKEEVQKNSIQL